MSKLTIAFFAGVLAFASLPVFAADLPDYGSKNFSAPEDTPAHFANEDLPVSARTADTTERDWSVVDAMTPARPSLSSRAAYRSAGRHGRYGFAHAPGRPTVAGWASKGHGTRTFSVHYHAGSSGISAKHSKPVARHASAAAHDAMM